jgi:hypothetical protein
VDQWFADRNIPVLREKSDSDPLLSGKRDPHPPNSGSGSTTQLREDLKISQST